ncbi:MAG TPA: class I SAM-dependent methyltransferase [Thermoanaerobaculia bacterium]|nr:class I SAM-dependent methyltransferase [Thermoanaerobaculia bacterium]
MSGPDSSGAPRGLNGLLSAAVKQFRLRRAAKRIPPGSAVLDLGCGLCELIPMLSQPVDYLGVERNEWMFERARRLFPGASFVMADLEDPQFIPPVLVDRIVLLAVWEHLHDPAALLRRARGWSKEGGWFLLTTPSPRAHALLEWGARLRLLSRTADEEHERLWNLDEIAALAEETGWSVVERETFLLGLNQWIVLRRV